MIVVKKVAKVAKKPLGGRTLSAPSGETSALRPQVRARTSPCTHGCPNHNDVRGALTTIAQSEAYGRTYEQSYEQAWRILAETNPMPATCGRVCPHPCESECNRKKVDEAASPNAVERFLGDFALAHKLELTRLGDEKHDEKVAIIGAGPAGLSCAYQLARRGYPVTIFEAFDHAGGMLRYGIPAYRLPRDVLQAEIERILRLGVELRLRTSIGRDIPYGDLKKDYRAIFVGIGAHKGVKLRVPGEEGAQNLFSGVEFLNKVNSGEKVEVGDRVVVIGGGDTAIDAARVARRLGAKVTILYRRTRKEMPAIEPEVDEAEKEGVELVFLTAPVEILRDGERATAIRCLRCELGEPDKSGRPRPVPVPGSEFDTPATTIIPAISQEPDFVGVEHLRSGKDWIKASELGEASEAGTFAGGDVLNLGLAAIALAQGRRAATTIDDYLRGRVPAPDLTPPPVVTADKMKISYFKPAPRQQHAMTPVEERWANPDGEIDHGLSEEQVIAEAKRCLSCGMCFDCDSCWMYCQNSVFVKQPKGQHYAMKLELCNGCKKCAEECPCGYLEMI